MGERIAVRLYRPKGQYGSIGFEYPEEISAVMYSHWGGLDYGFLHCIQAWLKSLPPVPDNGQGPIDRREPSALLPAFLRSECGSMVDRIIEPYKNPPLLDWGYWEVDTATGKARKVKTYPGRTKAENVK